MRRLAAASAAAALAALAALAPGPSPGAAPGDGQRVDVPALIARARALDLAAETAWRRLLHVPGRAGRGRDRSQVDDPAFFLSPHGRDDPAAELEATLRGLFDGPAPPSASPTAPAHPRCRFVARERWLRTRLGLPAAEVPAGCAAWHRWHATLDARSATLVFPAAYLNNPSSMFGHTLLRLDPPDVEAGSDWLSWSVNFAADTGDDPTAGALYAWRGLTGGYPGRFTLAPYFTTLRDYGAIENRDIWEYPLDLSPEEIERLVAHLWELRDVAFDYYYFRENCSLRLLELFEVARPSLDLVSAFPLTAIPADTVRAVSAAGLIEGVAWLPSQETLLRHALGALPRAERARARALAEDPAAGADARFLALPAPARARTVAAANRLLVHRARRAPRTPEGARDRLAMLTLLAEHGAGPGTGAGTGDAPPSVPPRPSSPDVGHATALASVGAGADRGRGHVELALRASYHDLLDPPAGYVPGASISLGNLVLRADEGGEARIESFELVGLRSLAPTMPGAGALSWGANVGLVRDEDVERGRLMGRIGGLAGLSVAFGERAGGPRALGYALAGPSLDALDRAGDAGLEARVNAHARLGLLGYARLGVSRLELGADALEGRSVRLVAELAHDLPLGADRSLRATGSIAELDGERREAASVALRVRF